MTRILFICHGNICRSPMAECIMKRELVLRDASTRYTVASCATSTEEIVCGIGNPVYPPARAELRKHGIDCGDKRAVQLKRTDYDNYDLLICMDESNVRAVLRITGGDPLGKVHKLLDFAEQGGDVADPWYTGRFDITYRDILRGCRALLAHLNV